MNACTVKQPTNLISLGKLKLLIPQVMKNVYACDGIKTLSGLD